MAALRRLLTAVITPRRDRWRAIDIETRAYQLDREAQADAADAQADLKVCTTFDRAATLDRAAIDGTIDASSRFPRSPTSKLPRSV